jgi:pyruvate ferredoxin oxidoreductase alpha subunit
MMDTWKLLDGNHAAAYAVKMVQPEVIAMYPITPQTECVSYISEFIEKKELRAKAVRVESEQSAMSVLLGASTMGSRVFSASSSQGIALMTEAIWMAAGCRLPIVLGVVNRPIGNPGTSAHVDLNDELLNRDAGWIQFFTESAQEVFDTIIQAYRISEDVLLPSMVGWEGRVVSHTAIPVNLPTQKEVNSFLPKYNPDYKLEIEKYTFKVEKVPSYDSSYEQVYVMQNAMEKAKTLIKKVNIEYSEIFGRRYGNGLIEEYQCKDAKAVLIAMGSIAGTTRAVIDEMRDVGKAIGLVKLRTFRPFPTEELRKVAQKVQAIGFIDRNRNPGSPGGGIGCIDTARALYSLKNRPHLIGFYAGLIGRDTRPHEIKNMAHIVLEAAETGEIQNEVEWIQLRE